MMESRSASTRNIDEYIARHSAEIRLMLEAMRETIRMAAPKATEKISYQMPTFYQAGNVVHFAAFKNHIGFYPTSSGIREFAKELSKYEGTKGAVRFPLGEPLPLALVGRITKFRVKENLERAAAKEAVNGARKALRKSVTKKK